MSARIEKVAAVKADVVKALNEIEHGDTTTAISALATGLINMLELVMEADEQLTAMNEQLAAIRKQKRWN